MINLLRGEDTYRRNVYFASVKKLGYKVLSYSKSAENLLDVLNVTNPLVKVAYVVSNEKLLDSISDSLISKSFPGFLIIDQADKSGHCFRRVARKFPQHVVNCDPIWAYKKEELGVWIEGIAKEMGIKLTPEEVLYLISNLGDESLEIYRVLELAKLSRTSVVEIAAYGTSRALLDLVDSVARHNYDLAIRSTVFLMSQGYEFPTMAHALLTRLGLLLKINCCRKLDISDARIIIKYKLSRMVAGNILSEAKMNTCEELIRLMKALIRNIGSPVGSEFLLILFFGMRKY